MNDSFMTSDAVNESFTTRRALTAFMIHSIVTDRVRRVTQQPPTWVINDASVSK